MTHQDFILFVVLFCVVLYWGKTVSPSPAGLGLAPQCRLTLDSPPLCPNPPRAGFAGVHYYSDPHTCAAGLFSWSHTQTLVLCSLVLSCLGVLSRPFYHCPTPATQQPVFKSVLRCHGGRWTDCSGIKSTFYSFRGTSFQHPCHAANTVLTPVSVDPVLHRATCSYTPVHN